MIRQFTKEQIGDVLQKIYDSEINITVYWIWNGGIDWRIGDKEKGYKETSETDASMANSQWGKIEHSISALAYEIYRLYPESAFAKWYSSLPSSPLISISEQIEQ